ncbi:hypothetical protein ECDEC3F_3268 [Escherichia coli DEC3F]|nr:hypothetical protein ECDEC3A_2898 [Escherichia coli DEC3A]EHU74422.1 hypothetical protein ECDEC3D_3044 [Escherichia coli DEC3D]EHU85539.1 hypothetical protein ECDEC3F_3268 [Escherichia coli DEC3F]EHV11753.1 hypothetical protein ECDEC4E_2887 [Escherichia coli DEC4E]
MNIYGGLLAKKYLESRSQKIKNLLVRQVLLFTTVTLTC